MSTGTVDLHIHSCHSDGTMSPRQIVEAAKARGVSLIAIADHDMLDGSRQLRELCKAEGRGYLPAVEMDCLEHGVNFHVLGYGVDLDDGEFVEFTKHNRAHLEQVNINLIEKMSKSVPGVSVEDYEQYEYDVCLGGWKALHYFVSKGLTASLGESIGFYSRYQCPHSLVDFPPVAAVCRAVRAASGVAVLAHPGELIDTSNLISFRDELNRLVEMGLNGIECYYPTHSPEITAECIKLCKEKNLLITAGSDCHGGFGRMTVGEMGITLDMLNLNGLL